MMQKAYSRINWENYPSDETPLNETNLNRMDAAMDELDNRVIAHETTKATKTEVATLVQDVTFEESTGIFTIQKKNGAVLKIDTKLEKIAVNFAYNSTTQQIILTLIDGTKQYIDLSALITQFEFVDTATIGFEITSGGKVKAAVLDGSITEDKLQPNYLADIKVEVAKAENSATAAGKSEANAAASANLATAKATEAANSATAAKTSETNAKTSETNAGNSAKKAESYAVGGTGTRTGEDTDNAMYYSQTADRSAGIAKSAANLATERATEAANSATAAKTSETNAKTSETNAGNSASSAATSATQANNYANGSTNSAKYYYEQAKSISESFAGALRPMGTVTFANLPSVSSAVGGDMYNVSNQFTTTSDFKEGAGNVIPAGANIYKTSDGKWDVLAGSPVTGVKGNAESSYRRGNVNITPANIGLGNVPNVATNDQTPTFTQASSRTNLISGEKISVLFGKIMKWFADLKTVAFSGSYNDLSDRPTIPTVGNGAITVTQNGTAKGAFTTNQSGNTTIALTDTNTWRGIQDNLTSDSATESLSAAQGKKLREMFADYLPLTGGTVNGKIGVQANVGVDSSSYANAAISVTDTNVAAGGRAGYGFHNSGMNGAYLYLDSDGFLKYLTNDGLAYRPIICPDNSVDAFKIEGGALFVYTPNVGRRRIALYSELDNIARTMPNPMALTGVQADNPLYGDPAKYNFLLYNYGNGNFAGIIGDENGGINLRTGNGVNHVYRFWEGTFYAENIEATSSVRSQIGQYAIYGNNLQNTTTGAHLMSCDDAHAVYTHGSMLGVLKHDGSWTNVCASAFSQQSSRRYKDHIEDMTDEDALKILRLRPVKYDYTNKSNGTDCRGLIAEEVDEVMTYPVVYDDEGQPDGIDYSKFVPYLIKTVQIQQEEINGLRAELGKLKETVAGITA